MRSSRTGRSASGRVPFWLALASAAALAAGCAPTTCDRSENSNPPLLYSEGKAENGVYMSSDWGGELLYFPGGMRYKLEHHLGRAPRSWQAYLSFDRCGTERDRCLDAGSDGAELLDGGAPGTLSPAAGNQAEVTCVDDRTLTVVNGSCSDYWLLMSAAAASDGEGDAGADTHCTPPSTQ